MLGKEIITSLPILSISFIMIQDYQQPVRTELDYIIKTLVFEKIHMIVNIAFIIFIVLSSDFIVLSIDVSTPYPEAFLFYSTVSKGYRHHSQGPRYESQVHPFSD